MKSISRRCSFRSSVIAVSAAALAAPAVAQAHVELGPGGSSPPRAAAVSPDDRAGVRGAGASQASSRVATPNDFRRIDAQSLVGVRPATLASADDRAGIRGVGSRLAAPVVGSSASNGFSWTAAGIGAGTAALILVLVGGILLAAGRRPRRGQLAL